MKMPALATLGAASGAVAILVLAFWHFDARQVFAGLAIVAMLTAVYSAGRLGRFTWDEMQRTFRHPYLYVAASVVAFGSVVALSFL